MRDIILNVDLCVIGAGSSGLSVAAGAAQLCASTVLVERHQMGGDCLNIGCVPSKALLAAATAARRWRSDQAFSVTYAPPIVDFPAVSRHVHEVIAAIAPNDPVERFERLGVKVIKSTGRFVGPRESRSTDERREDPRRFDRRRARRRADPSLGAGHQPRSQEQGIGLHDRALSDARRVQQTRCRQLLHPKLFSERTRRLVRRLS